ncbi:hypothetical protein [Sanyastnella coralliicola]|uniref:hypothetical protein n=1 Tax=Sanyastnella coralliicola TaxID=3069118 RepID=UPI0027B881DF|nr:hypothetical protein [Longitalea sp. SCSIO 12813]
MRLFLSLLVLSLTISAPAQEYVPFISTADSSDSWTEVNSCSDFQCFTTYTHGYTIDGDTVLNGVTYAKLMSLSVTIQGAVSSEWCTIDTSSYYYYYGGIREEDKRIYLKRTFEEEYIVYDFNLNIGDTVPSPAGIAGLEQWRVIESIDEIEVNGTSRQRYQLTGNTYLVEGIGASSGLFNSVQPVQGDCWFEMICYREEGESHHFTSNCGLSLSVDDFTISSSKKELLKIVNLQGQEVEPQPNQILIYLYSDGSAEKMVHIE